MTTAFICAATWAVLSYRMLPFDKATNKRIHGVLHSTAVICFSLGLYAVVTGNNSKESNLECVYYPNLVSLHSWIGVITIALYSLNYIFGFLIFGTDIFSVAIKRMYLSHHASLGTLLVVLAGLAAETGIMELSTEAAKCGYPLDKPDYNPALHYSELTPGCKLANGAGLMVLLAVACAVFVLLDRPKAREEDAGLLGENYPLTS